MAKSPKNIPNGFPQPLGTQILKGDAFRQAVILRQEFITDLVEAAMAMPEGPARGKLAQLIQKHLKAGIHAAEKAEELWPELDEAREIIAEKCPKPAAAQKHFILFQAYDALARKSLALLHDSHANIQIIVDRMSGGAPAPAAPKDKKAS